MTSLPFHQNAVHATINKAFWRNKRVLLTGHTGFKGGWMSLWLESLGAKVTGYALEPPTVPSFFQACKLNALLSASHIADIRDLDTLKQVFLDSKPEIVFHMAAQPLVRLSYAQPVETYATNVMGTVHVLEAARLTPSVRAIVNITTDKCYENREWDWGYRETDRLGGHDPYSNSKGCAEMVSAAYRNAFFLLKEAPAIATVRAGNVIGGGDWALDRLIPDVIRAFCQKIPVVIRNPRAIRPWQHVLEPLSGYLLLAEKLYETGHSFGEGWNFGPSDEDAQPVQWIVEKLANQWGSGACWQLDSCQKHPHEATYLKLDCSKAKSRLGWHARWPLSVALEKIVEWYQVYLSDSDMFKHSLSQIEAFSLATIKE